jgi:thioredoxin 2
MSTLSADARGVILPCPHCGQYNRLPYARLGQRPRCARCHETLPQLDAPVELDDETAFNALTTSSPLPVLVDFWAAWCGPCKMIAPEIAKVAAQADGRWVVAKVNTELLPAPAQRFRVTSIPLLVLLRQGQEIARQAGALPAASIRQFLAPHVNFEM